MEYFTSDEDYEVKSVEAVFTDINQAAKYIISHKEDADNLRIEKYETDENIYLNNLKPKKIVMGRYFPRIDFWSDKKITYDYHYCEELIEKEDCVLVSTTVPVELRDSDAYEILKNKYKLWENTKKEDDYEKVD
jgi:hypothetical protein